MDSKTHIYGLKTINQVKRKEATSRQRQPLIRAPG